MALTNEELQDIISNLSPEERKQLLSQLGRQVEVDNITNPTQSTNTKPKVKPKSDNLILSILVYTLFSRMFDLMQPPVVKHSIAVA